MKKNDFRLYHQKLWKTFFLTGFFLGIFTLLQAQSSTSSLKGKVIENNKVPVEGATITIKHTTSGIIKNTITNKEGAFEFFELAINSLLDIEVTAVGYETYNFKNFVIKSGPNNSILIPLKEKPQDMEDVVVTGYSTQKRRNVTGAVSQIGAEVVEDRPSPSLSRLLQGTISNLNLKMVDGSPTRSASFNVRGTTSIGAGGSALVLIDGVEGNPDLVNPNDIQSVTVLKDASSAAIYGSRASFGVVLITTKSAQKGQVKVNINSNYSINNRVINPNTVTNGYKWAQNFAESFNAWYDYNSFPTVVNNIFPFSMDYLERLRERDENPSLPKVEYNSTLGRYEYFENTDWFDVLYNKNIPATEQSVSVSGGSETANFYLSGRYYFQDGVFNYNPDKFNRYNVRAKGEVKVKPWLILQNNFELSNQTYFFPMLADRDNQTVWRMMDLLTYPMAAVSNPDGTLTHTAVYGGIGSYIDGNNHSNTNSTYFRNTAGFVAKALKNKLTFKGDLTFAKTNGQEERVNNFVDYFNAPNTPGRLGRSLLQKFTDNRTYIAGNITADYSRTFNDKHEISALLGYNVESSKTQNFNASRDGLLIPSKPDFNLMDGLNYTISGGLSEWAYLGAFYRANYSYDDRFLVEFNGRYDGSSKFPQNQRFGFFPSVSAGWRISNERFMDRFANQIDELKIRASYGSLGNGNVAPYRYLEQMSVLKMSSIIQGVQPNYTAMPAVIPNGLTWERSVTLNLGIDLSLFNKKLNTSFDWFNRATKDMFTAGQPLPTVFGATVPFGNYADLSTKGWEFTVSYANQFLLGNSPFQYKFSGSLWDSKATITRFNNEQGNLNTYYVGHTIGEIWGYTTLGLFRSAEEIEKHADQSFLQNSASRVLLPGDIKFADLDGDGKISQGDNTIFNPGDRKIIGNNSPRYQFGFTLSANWHNFGITAFFQGIGKRDWYFAPEAGAFWGLYNRPYGFQPTKMMENVWSESNPDAYFPRLRGYIANSTARSLGAPQTRYLQDASYLRLKNLTLDYKIPANILKKAGLQAAAIFFTTQNLFTLSGMFKYSEGIDPEIIESPVGDLLNNSGQGYAYPMLKSTTIGINISF